MRTICGLILGGCFFCCCSTPEQQGIPTVRIDVSAARPSDLQQLVDKIHVFPLETHDSCLIGQRHTLQVRNGHYYINNEQKEVLQFDHQGKFLRTTLPSYGPGPQDYAIAVSSYIDKEEQLGIYEVFLPRIQEYDKEFRYRQTVRIDVPDTRSSQLQRQYVKVNDSLYVVKDYKDIHFYSTAQSKVVKSLHDEFPSLLAITTQLRLVDYDNAFHYSPSYSCDTLYRLDEHQLTLEPEVIFDFGGKSFQLQDLPTDMTPQYYQQFLVETDRIIVLEKIHLPNQIYCFFLQGKNSYVSRTSETKTMVYRQEKGAALSVPQAVEGHRFYALVWPDKVEEYVDSRLLDADSRQRISQLNMEGNPVIICYEMK